MTNRISKYDQTGELVWKWLLRLTGLIVFVFITVLERTVPAYAYILLAGMMALPNVIQLQRTLNSRIMDPTSEEE